jgi:hypothetical protein
VEVPMIAKDIEKLNGQFVRIIASDSVSNNVEHKKIVIRPIMLKGNRYYQFERFKGTQVHHLNMEEEAFPEMFMSEIDGKYRQIVIYIKGMTISYSMNTSGKYKRKELKNDIRYTSAEEGNNRVKNYILSEGENIPAFVDLGIFTQDLKVVKSKYDKFKQINRFIELIDDAYSRYDRDEITILDFGSGKSYLTFIVYYYFVVMKGIRATIIGYDLKQDVVENCNRIAHRYGYENLKFMVGDVSKDILYDQKIDMIITLHACDTATDHALFFAISNNVNNIFSVPCCQHEINNQIQSGGEMDILLRYGIAKERVSALLTDSIRASILEDMGYKVDMIEFVNLEHTPKNIMIRAKISRKKSNTHASSIQHLCDKYQFKQTLFTLVQQEYNYGK